MVAKSNIRQATPKFDHNYVLVGEIKILAKWYSWAVLNMQRNTNMFVYKMLVLVGFLLDWVQFA